MIIDDATIEAFEVDGGVAIRGLLDLPWIESLRDAMPAIFEHSYDPLARSQLRQPEERTAQVVQSDGMWRECEPFRRFLFESPIGSAAATILRSTSVRLYEDLLLYREAGRENGAPASAWRQNQERRDCRLDIATAQGFLDEALLPAAIGSRRQMLQAAAAAIGEMRTGGLGPLGALLQTPEDTPPPAPLAVILQTDEQAIAGRCIGDKDSPALEMTDAIARQPQRCDLDLGLERQRFYPFSPSMRPLS